MQEVETIMVTTALNATTAVTLADPFNAMQEMAAEAVMQARAMAGITVITTQVTTPVIAPAATATTATTEIINLVVRKTGFCELF